MSRVWIHQDDKQVKKYGEDAASWYVSWLDPEGKRRCKSCGKGSRGKRRALKLRQKREEELINGTYSDKSKVTWQTFRQEYEAKILPGLSVKTRYEVKGALEHFQRIIKPGRVFVLATSHVDRYIATRRKERGKLKGTLVSPATINKEMRHLKAVLGIASEWGYLKTLPKFRMEKTPKKLPTYVSPEHFAALYKACEEAKLPTGKPYTPADWWRSLLMTAYMTGWRIGAILAMRRKDLDLDAGVTISRAEDNKGKRDVKTPLHPLVVEHLRKLPGFDRSVFPWPYPIRRLYDEFQVIQDAAGVQNEEKGRPYGFHDLRRAFATMNADRLTAEQLQTLMQHKSYQTTLGYISMARQLNPALQNLYVPDLTEKKKKKS